MSVAGNGGACCECTQLTGCDCVTLVGSTIACQSKGGTAALCGYPEWADVSTPPKKYLKCTAAGLTSFHSGCSTGCGDCAYYNEEVYAGTGIFSPTTCEEVVTMTRTYRLNGGTPTVFSVTPGSPFIKDYSGAVNITNVVGRVNISQGAFEPACRENFGGSALTGEYTATKELTDEDTDDNAEARAIALIGAWTACADCSIACSAFRAFRTTGYSFSFRKVQAQVSWLATSRKAELLAIALAVCADAAAKAAIAAAAEAARAADPTNPTKIAYAALTAAEAAAAAIACTAANAEAAAASASTTYNVKTRFYRRVLGSTGPYIYYALDERTITITGILTPTMAFTPWIDVPNEAGWETIAGGQTVETVP